MTRLRAADAVKPTGIGRAAASHVARPLKFIFMRLDTGKCVDLHVAKWGNSIGLPLPSAVVRRLGLKEGLTVRAQVTSGGLLAIRVADWSRASFAAELIQTHAALPLGSSVVEELRRAARY